MLYYVLTARPRRQFDFCEWLTASGQGPTLGGKI
jgi:hypothetical protein